MEVRGKTRKKKKIKKRKIDTMQIEAIADSEGLGTLGIFPSEVILNILSRLRFNEQLKAQILSKLIKNYIESIKVNIPNLIFALHEESFRKGRDYYELIAAIKSRLFYKKIIEKPVSEMNVHELILFLLLKESYANMTREELWEIKDAIAKTYESEDLNTYNNEIFTHLNLLDLFLRLNYFAIYEADMDKADEAIKLIMLEINNLFFKIEKHIALQFPGISFSFIERSNRVVASLKDLDLSNSNLKNAKLSCVELDHIFLINAELNYANLTNSQLLEVDLTRASLRGAQLMESKLKNVSLINTKLALSDFTYCDAQKVDLSEADLTKAVMISANFSDSNFTSAILWGTDLRGCYFNRCNLRKADLRNAYFEETHFEDAEFEETLFIDENNVSLKNPASELNKLNQSLFCQSHASALRNQKSNNECKALRLAIAEDFIRVVNGLPYTLEQKKDLLKAVNSHPVFLGKKINALKEKLNVLKNLSLSMENKNFITKSIFPFYYSPSQQILRGRRRQIKKELKNKNASESSSQKLKK